MPRLCAYAMSWASVWELELSSPSVMAMTALRPGFVAVFVRLW